ncbi:hypothetical protein KQ41_06505 [Lysinibacillus fusiformis]|uniref:hypothetical protein n=1 Tax=Lysinibacillus fusiformis TaxID=28031 RepID=UPI000500C7DE|nr:hypothetical protein [Lysinibacillus fusiformis]KGA83687.1 hypothetical protein KQ41_06505 [Lysinibacillus fusiformis]
MTEQYIASIKNTTTGSWLKSTTSFNKTNGSWFKPKITHNYIHTLIKEERFIFRDKKEAESTLETLQENYPDTFTLVIETTTGFS